MPLLPVAGEARVLKRLEEVGVLGSQAESCALECVPQARPRGGHGATTRPATQQGSGRAFAGRD